MYALARRSRSLPLSLICCFDRQAAYHLAGTTVAGRPKRSHRIALPSTTAHYDARFIVTLNMVTHASLTCISLHASYDESLISVQRTR